VSKAGREHSHLGCGAGGHLACHGTDRKNQAGRPVAPQAGCLCYDDAESSAKICAVAGIADPGESASTLQRFNDLTI